VSAPQPWRERRRALVAGRREPRRLVVLAVLCAVLAIAAVVSAASSTSRPGVAAQSDSAVGGAAQSTAFYCAGLEHVAGSVTSDVAIADLAATPRTVELTTSDTEGHFSVRQLTVHPGKVAIVEPGNFLRGPSLAVSVNASGGDVAVSEALRSVNGTAVTPCLSGASTSWWVTGGSTEPGESFVVVVFNPYAARAVASVTLSTPAGNLVPSAYGGLVIGPHSLEALHVHDVAPDESPITAHVVVTDGDVVAYGLGLATLHQTSISLLPATPGASREVAVPSASSDPSLTTSLLLSTTGTSTVSATVQVLAPSGCTTRCPAPFDVSVPPGPPTPLTLSPTSRVPLDEQLSVLVHASGPGVVVTERVSTLGAVGQAAALDDPQFVGARRLVLVDPLGAGLFGEVGVVNPTGTTVSVRLATVTPSGPVSLTGTYQIGPHTNLVLNSRALRGMDDGVLEVVATGDVSAAAQVPDATPGAATLAAAPAQ
jgi:hypothetical protein